MYEAFREQRPLLSEDISDEEFKIQTDSPRFNRRFRNSAYSGRAAAKAKGAIAVITRWPDNLSTLLAYWWAGLGMIALTIFIIYNSLSIIKTDAFVTAIQPRISRYREKNITNTTNTSVDFLNMYMHVFIKEDEKDSINKYLPDIKTLSNKYSNIKYNFVVVINDLSIVKDEATDDVKNNEIALNSLWTDNIKIDKKKWTDNIAIQHISLTKLLDESPLRIHWRSLPRQFIEFLVRFLAIWEKGGVAVNPLMLTSKPHGSIYMEKLNNILKEYTQYVEHDNIHNDIKNYQFLAKKKPKHQVNNIRDIINNLNDEDSNENFQQFNLTEAENREQLNLTEAEYINNKKRKRDSKYTQNDKGLDITSIVEKTKSEYDDDKTRKIYVLDSKFNNSKPEIVNRLESIEMNSNLSSEHTTNSNFLPMFLNYLFHDETKKSHLNNDTSPSFNDTIKLQDAENNNERQSYDITPKIYPKTLNIVTNSDETIQINGGVENYDQNPELTIDIKGNFVATKTSCHAFIGSILSNIKNHSNEESLTDLIIAELSIFCKGVLRTCKGVDVILL